MKEFSSLSLSISHNSLDNSLSESNNDNNNSDEEYFPSNMDISSESEFIEYIPKKRKKNIRKKICCRFKCQYCNNIIKCNNKSNHMLKYHYEKCNPIQKLNHEFNNSVKYLRNIMFYKYLLMESERRIKNIKINRETKMILKSKPYFLKYQMEYKNEAKQSLERLNKNNNKNLLNDLLYKSQYNLNYLSSVTFLNESEDNLSD